MRLFLLLLLSSCAILHRVQAGEVDSGAVLKGRQFIILVSETGVDIDQAASLGQVLARNFKGKKGANESIKRARKVLTALQMGPKTGHPVFSTAYVDQVFDLVHKECPYGKINGLTSIRETAKYPVVSGEIIKIIGYCKKI